MPDDHDGENQAETLTPKQLREARAKLVPQIRKLADKQNADGWNAEERGKWEALNTDYDALSDRIKRAEEGEAIQARAKTLEDEQRAPAERRSRDPNPGREDYDGRGNHGGLNLRSPHGDLEYRGVDLRDAFGEDPRFDALERRSTDEYNRAHRRYLSSGSKALDEAERRALSADLATEGGYLLPTQTVMSLIKTKDNMVLIRARATVIPVTSGDSLGVPSLDADPADADWTSEIKTGSADSTMSFGGRELHPHPLAKRIKVSRKLLRTSAIPIPMLVNQRLAYKFGVTEEKGFLTGSGAQQPLGVFTASDYGISTGRDVATDFEATSITADGLIEVKYTLKAQYWPNAAWCFHRDGVKQIRKLKTGDGQYLWQPGLQAGQPDRILDFPVMVSEYAPNTFTASQYVGILGDFSFYWIADSLAFTVQELIELYAETNQVGYIARAETDGMPVLEEAFVRCKLAAS